METKITTPQIKGLIIALILIVWGLIIYFTNQLDNQPLSYVQYAIFLGGIIWSCISYSKQMNANVTFGNVFAHGFKTSAVVTILILVYTVVAFNFLFPDIVDKSMEISRKKLEGSGKLSDTQIDQQINMIKDHFTLFAVAGIVIGFAIMGAVSSLIGAAVTKKQPKDPFSNQPI
jgi:uncharacterized protein DUF4199